MSVSTTSSPVAQVAVLRPRFFGLVQGELFKMQHRKVNWFLLASVLILISLFWLVLLLFNNGTDSLKDSAVPFFYGRLDNGLSLFRAFAGFYMVVVAAQIFGLDYQQGTIRLILSRGVRRLQLLFAKLCAALVIALGTLLLGLTVNLVGGVIVVTAKGGTLNAIPSQLWSNLAIYALTIFISLAVTILLTMAATVIGRSIALGVGLGMIVFPTDNFAASLLPLATLATKNNLWKQITDCLLGPNLNLMPAVWVPKLADAAGGAVVPLGTVPPDPLSLPLNLAVVLAYAVVFLVISCILTARRDVTE